MRRPRIGIPLCLDDRGRWRPGREYAYTDQAYAAAVDDAGGAPIHLPIQSSLDAVLESIDGLLIPGGDDLPALAEQNERPPADELLDLTPAPQIEFDTALCERAREANIPILGICYGMQLLARTAGGRLDLHLPSQRPECADHKFENWDERHPVHLEPTSRLATVVGTVRLDVNSFHHQAVREPGRGQRIAATSPDGLIEAIESDAPESFVIGVQWHPEKMSEDSSRRLFRAFVDAARERAESATTR